MPKTKRDLLHAIADAIGGARGAQMRDVLGRKTPIDDLLDRPMPDEEFVIQLKRAVEDWPKVMEQVEAMGEKPRSWGQPN